LRAEAIEIAAGCGYIIDRIAREGCHISPA